MLVAKFHCPECNALLKPSSPQQEGKKVKCPKCACTFTVPSQESDEPDELEEAEARPSSRVTTRRAERQPAVLEEEEDRPVRRRTTRRDEDEEEEERPARRRAAREEEPEEDREEPRNRRKKPRKKAQGGSALKIVLILGVVLFLLVGVSVGGYFLVTTLLVSPAQARARILDEATAALAGVKDQASATAARPKLVRVGERLKELHAKDLAELEKGLKKLADDPDMVKNAMDEAMRNPDKARAQMEKIEKEQRPLREAMQKMIVEATRVSKVPGGPELLNAFYDAWGPGSGEVKMAIGLVGAMDGFGRDPNPGMFGGMAAGGGVPGAAPAGNMPGAAPAGGMAGGNGPPPAMGFGKLSQQNYDSIQPGMSEQQVIDILGAPAFTHANGPGGKKFQYAFGFITLQDGRVTKKGL